MLPLSSDTQITGYSDAEREQAIFRMAIGGAGLAYCICGYLFIGDHDPGLRKAISICSVFLVFAAVLLFIIIARPAASPARRIVAMATDVGTTAILMRLVGEPASVFIFIYVWVIVGNGLRYGERYLYPAMALGVSSYLWVMAVTPFWIAHRYVAIGTLLSLILLPAYFASLLRKINIAQRESARLAEKLKSMAMHDTLTELPNRRLFVEHLESAIAQAEGRREHLALLFVDLDGFKPVNDVLGHTTGDELLRIIGARLRLSVREGDLVARLGGDEFVVVLENIDLDSVGVVARKIMAAVGSDIDFAGNHIAVSCSIGIALYPEHGRNIDALLGEADRTMQVAKRSGKNRYYVEAGETARQGMAN